MIKEIGFSQENDREIAYNGAAKASIIKPSKHIRIGRKVAVEQWPKQINETRSYATSAKKR